ncbi:PIR protein [Plasmodium vivax]|uniref:VIR protein n=1 Tax=Plasmodium vivax TaxID=5855 RepID=A0A564ZYV3_PLAVI|nr:PIR protein [Plasmodium vivax]
MSFFGLNICKQDLPSKELYDAWNKKLSSIDINRECKSEKSLYTGNKNDIILKICSIALEYLKNNNTKPTKKNLSSCNRCKLFNYWVLKKLHEIFKDDYLTAFNYLTFKMKSFDFKKYYLKNNACKLDYDIARDNEREVKKEFYEYLENYYHIDIRSKINHPECKEYKEYFKSRHPLRKYIIQILPDVEKQKFSSIYGTNNNCNTKNILSKLIDSDLDLTEEDSEESSGEASFLEAVYNIKKELQNYEFAYNPLTYLKLQWDYGIYKLKNSSPYAMPSMLSVAGVSAASMFFYKFTPLGPLLRGRRSKNLNIHNFNETLEGTLPDFYEELANVNSGNERINIAYHPE